ncbi:xylan glycosyltransferase MUCI21 [Elaeis guineensis]|uniref:Beta-1,2-xylosyltransferase XYXT1 n=1 Tax=Elaeis guineensis var. tenera TaxID=51953 RepID=A0A6I9R7T6_ELAGV|nr:beta-1,2-xylosyltransferase XYXT1 [Elaeis guineensis]
MVHHHHHHRISYFQQLRKGEAQQQQQHPDFMEPHHCPSFMYHDYFNYRKSKLAALRFLFLFSLLSCSFFFGPRLLFYSLGTEYESELQTRTEEENRGAAPCSSMANNTICCDRTAFRTDVCYMRGDVRTHSPSNSILLFDNNSTTAPSIEEKIRPYTRKWETSIMDTIDELRLRTAGAGDLDNHRCDVRHDVPAVVFSTGGYTGNVYHEFNDGIIPLYITSHHFNRQVVFVMLEYHDWWMTKYSDVVSRLSAHPPIDYSNDRRTHCFSEVIVGLRIHDELTVESDRMESNKTVLDFRQLLDEAYTPRVRTLMRAEEQATASLLKPVTERNVSAKEKPKLVVVSRNGSRAIENEGELVKLAEGVGFEVKVLRPERTTELARIYQALNSCDAMVGVHGAAMTHFLFMRPGSVFIQIVPLGTDWAAETYYGEPAKKMGLRYFPYKILPRESSLYREYRKGDPVLRDPESVNAKGWQVTKKVYLDGQNVRVDLARFRKRLFRAQQYIVSRKTSMNLRWRQQGRRQR